ncbi:hypothetical protein [Helicobacter equorum]|uniref:hypothetical protein n=1 Tax=Helicobacter equorum TaxID=361872 RepID=UPI000CF1C246|nr:hypothetical protein [Helicobacter equorum]
MSRKTIKQYRIYTSLNICQCEFNENLPQKKKVLSVIGSATGAFLNIYLSANSAFVSGMSDTPYPKNCY